MGLGIPALITTTLLRSNPLKSRSLVWRLAVTRKHRAIDRSTSVELRVTLSCDQRRVGDATMLQRNIQLINDFSIHIPVP